MGVLATVRTGAALFTAALILELGLGAAAVHPERLQALLWEESLETRLLLGGFARRAALDAEAAFTTSLEVLGPPVRQAWESERLPGLNPAGGRLSALQDERTVRTALARLFGSAFCESVRLMGLLAAKRLSRLAVILLLSLPLLLALTLDGFLVRRLRQAAFRAPRPSLFSGLGVLLGTLPAATVLAGFLPVALPVAGWGLVPVAAGVMLRACAANWHRFE